MNLLEASRVNNIMHIYVLSRPLCFHTTVLEVFPEGADGGEGSGGLSGGTGCGSGS